MLHKPNKISVNQNKSSSYFSLAINIEGKMQSKKSLSRDVMYYCIDEGFIYN